MSQQQTDDSVTDNRVMELEIRMTHLEDTIEVLNRTIIEQHASIDGLKLKVEMLEKKFKATMEAAGASIVAPQSEETPPPHY
jgi:SlyX protein